jgi:hypothetical protein
VKHHARQGGDLVPALPAAELRSLRREAEARYGEVHLLAAALQEHLDDLRIERDRLLTQVAALRDDARRDHAGWLHRGLKPNRQR